MRYLLFVILATLIACGGDSEFHQLESTVSKDPTNQNVTELIRAYSTWLDTTSLNNPKYKEVLNKLYSTTDEYNRYSNKVYALRRLILEYPDDPRKVEYLVELSNTNEKLERNMAAHVINQGLVMLYPDDPMVNEQIAPKLSADSESADSTIMSLGRAMFDDETMKLNARLGRQYIDACEAYATIYDGKAQAAELLNKAAETARSLNTINRALSLYNWIIERYPDHPRTRQALFLKAFTYDSNMGDVENARKYYNEFLEKYPEGEFSQDARFLLENLGKDDQELLEILQQKASEQVEQ